MMVRTGAMCATPVHAGTPPVKRTGRLRLLGKETDKDSEGWRGGIKRKEKEERVEEVFYGVEEIKGVIPAES